MDNKISNEKIYENKQAFFFYLFVEVIKESHHALVEFSYTNYILNQDISKDTDTI